MDLHQYFYFIGVTLLLPIWIVLFSRKEGRKDMLLIGALGGIIATIIEHLYSMVDYWTPIFIIPQFPFESFYYGFILIGIATEIYEYIFKRRNSKTKRKFQYFNLLFVFILALVLCFWFFVNILQWNSIIACIVPSILAGIAIVILRKDFLFSSVFTGIFIMILTGIMFVILHIWYPEIFINHWMLENLSGIFIIGIPLEEFLFAFSVGFTGSNVYEFFFGYTLVKEK